MVEVGRERVGGEWRWKRENRAGLSNKLWEWYHCSICEIAGTSPFWMFRKYWIIQISCHFLNILMSDATLKSLTRHVRRAWWNIVCTQNQDKNTGHEHGVLPPVQTSNPSWEIKIQWSHIIQTVSILPTLAAATWTCPWVKRVYRTITLMGKFNSRP